MLTTHTVIIPFPLILLQHDMRTLKKRVGQFIPQCDELIQFSPPSVKRVVSKIVIPLISYYNHKLIGQALTLWRVECNWLRLNKFWNNS